MQIALSVNVSVGNTLSSKCGVIMLELLLTLGDKINTGPVGQATWTTPGTYTWTVPEDVTSVCVCAVGQGQYCGPTYRAHGSSGGVRWMNNIPVIPGDTYEIRVGSGTFLFNPTTVNDFTSGFGLKAWPPNTSGPTGSVGYAGAQMRVTPGNNPTVTVWNYGCSSATFSSPGIVGSKEQATNYNATKIAKGVNIVTGQVVSATSVVGASAGGGGTGQVNPGGSEKGNFAGDGAFRIIWGPGRAYPNKLIGNI